MSFGIICRHKGCGGCRNLANFRYTWPGSNESFICAEHAGPLLAIARGMGLHVQLIALTGQDHSGPIGMQSIEEQQGASI